MGIKEQTSNRDKKVLRAKTDTSECQEWGETQEESTPSDSLFIKDCVHKRETESSSKLSPGA